MKASAKPRVLRSKKRVAGQAGSAGTHVEFIHSGGKVKVVKVPRASGAGRRLVERMAGSGHGKYTTEQIMKLTRG
jgi:hypothetical protein